MKLYWRYKKDGKWTWAPAVIDRETTVRGHRWGFVVRPLEEEE